MIRSSIARQRARTSSEIGSTLDSSPPLTTTSLLGRVIGSLRSLPNRRPSARMRKPSALNGREQVFVALLCASCACLVTFTAPSVAFGARNGTPPERRSVARAAGLDSTRCATIRFSTERQGWVIIGKQSAKRCASITGDGRTLFRKRDGRWRQVVAGSSIECPLPNVPDAVEEDLRVCDIEYIDLRKARAAIDERVPEIVGEVSAQSGVPPQDLGQTMDCDDDGPQVTALTCRLWILTTKMPVAVECKPISIRAEPGFVFRTIRTRILDEPDCVIEWARPPEPWEKTTP